MSVPHTLLVPSSFLPLISSLPFTERKSLGQSPRPLKAALYAIHRAHVARLTTDDEWTPIWGKKLGAIAGNKNQWIKVKGLLDAADLLECDGNYRVGEKSHSYRLGSLLRSPEIEWVERKENLDLPKAGTNETVLMDWLSLDKEKAHRITDEIAPGRGWTKQALQARHTAIENFQPTYRICRTGRAYSDANRLPEEVREALLIDGQETEEPDIANCQPLLLATIYQSKTAEAIRYRKLAERGRVYEHFASHADITRQESKEALVPFIFGKTRGDGPKLVRQYLNQKFPELLAAIEQRRKTHYKALAYELQRSESAVIVKGVCRAMRAVSIHDGVRVKKGEGEMAKAIISKLFGEMWGLKPSFKPSSDAPSEKAA